MDDNDDRRNQRPISNRAIRTSVVLTLIVAIVVGYFLTQYLGAAGIDQEPRARALQLAGQFVLGTGGLLALYFTARRQQWTEFTLKLQQAVADANNRDAEERRITELFGQAVEQIGSDKAPVRLAGLYSLERLGNHSASQRSKIMDVLCAYLRMPSTDSSDKQEQEVRLTAQRIIKARTALAPIDGEHWERSILNLAGAHLDDLDLNHCSVESLQLDNAVLTGSSNLEDIRVANTLSMASARVDGELTLGGEIGSLILREASFVEDVDISGLHVNSVLPRSGIGIDGNKVTFQARLDARSVEVFGMANLKRASFGREVLFSGSTFQDILDFSGATFEGYLALNQSRFKHYLVGSQCSFGRVDLSDSTIGGKCRFNSCTFTHGFECERSEISNEAEFSNTKFGADVEFGDTVFGKSAMFYGSEFGWKDQAELPASDSILGSTEFRGCSVAGLFDLSGAVFRGRVHFDPDVNADLDGAQCAHRRACNRPEGWQVDDTPDYDGRLYAIRPAQSSQQG